MKNLCILSIYYLLTIIIGLNLTIFKNCLTQNIAKQDKEKQNSCEKLVINVVIIGAGIGGSSLTYFLREIEDKYKEDFYFNITIFEKERRVGGRIYSRQLQKNISSKVELGPQDFKENDFYIKMLTEKMNISRHQLPRKNFKNVALQDGKNIVSNLIFCKDVDSCFEKKYNSTILKNAIKLTSEAMSRLNKIYQQQKNGQATKNISQQLKFLRLDGYSTKTLSDVYKEFVGKDEQNSDTLFANEYINGMLHFAYYNDIQTVNGLAGLLGTYFLSNNTGLDQKIFDGNDMLVKKLVENSGAKIKLNTNVTEIKINLDGTFKLLYENYDKEDSENFDIVVLATPNALSNIQIKRASFKKEKTQFMEIFQLFVNAIYNPSFFKFRDVEMKAIKKIADINSMKNITKFSTMTLIENTFFKNMIYAMFPKPLRDEEIIQLFKNLIHEDARTYVLGRYPNLKPKSEYDSFNPMDGLFYINAIEDVASSAEISCIGAKNVGLLIEKFLVKVLRL